MKARLFRSSKGGWYLYGTNYKDKNDKAYCNIHFANNYAIAPNTTGDYVDVRIDEASCNSYQGKFGLTIFKYELLNESQVQPIEEENEYSQNFGGETKVDQITINPDDLPFY